MLIYAANDGVHGLEPWVVDATTFRTFLLFDIYPGSDGSKVQNFYSTPVGTPAMCVFMSAADNVHGPELWATAGPAAGAYMIGDLNPGADGSAPYGFATVGSSTYFGASRRGSGNSIWKTTCAAGTAIEITDICFGACGAKVASITPCGSFVYFAATSLLSGNELWRSDGTGPGTFGADMVFGPGSSSPKNLLCMNGVLYFNGFTSSVGRALFTATPALVVTLVAVPSRNITKFGPENMGYPGTPLSANKFFFSGYNESSGYEPFVSDGTASGTFLLHDANAGKKDSLPGKPGDWVSTGTTVLFAATTEKEGRQVWSTRGTPTLPPVYVPPPNTTRTCIVLTSATTNTTCSAAILATPPPPRISPTPIPPGTRPSQTNVTAPPMPAPSPTPNISASPLPAGNTTNGTTPRCTIPLTREVITDYTVYTQQNITVNASRSAADSGGNIVVEYFNRTESLNLSTIVRSRASVPTNTFPCIYDKVADGASAKSVTFPAPLATTFLYCMPGNGSASPEDFAVVAEPVPKYATYRAQEKLGFYQLYAAVVGNETLPPPGMPPRTGGVGVCERVYDINGLYFENVQRPVYFPGLGLTFFMARKGAVTGLWYIDVKSTATAPMVACPAPGHVPNSCGRCAPIGDHLSCRGLSCGPTRVLDGCGHCVEYNQTSLEGYYDQCTCDFNPTFTIATPGFGQYSFNDMSVAITNCLSKHVRMFADATIAAPMSIAPDSLKISSDPATIAAAGTRRRLCAHLEVVGGTRGLSFQYLTLCPSSPACAAAGASQAIVYGSLTGPGVLNATDVVVDMQGCASAFRMTLSRDAYFARNTFTGPSNFAGVAVNLNFLGCASNNTLHNHLNFTNNTGTLLSGGWVYADRLTSAYVVGNRCGTCGDGGVHDSLVLLGCVGGNMPAWFEVGRNTIHSPVAAPGNTFRFSTFNIHNIYGNIGSNRATCIRMIDMSVAPTRGPPMPDLPSGYTVDDSEEAAARHIAYYNERCLGTGIDIRYNGGGACDGLCGMDEFLNLGMSSKQAAVSAANYGTVLEKLTTVYTISLIHLENGYGNSGILRYKSTYHRLLVVANVSPGLQGLTFVLLNTSQPGCIPETLDRQSRCRQLYTAVFDTGANGLPIEVAGDFNVHATLWINFEERALYDTVYIPFEWYRDERYRTRLYSGVASMFSDSALTLPQNLSHPIPEDTLAYIRVRLDRIDPELPGDRTQWHELRIVRAVACFPNASQEGTQAGAWVAFKWAPGPVKPYYPYIPRDTGCWTQGLGIGTPYVIYDEKLGANATTFAAYQPRVFRNPAQLLSEHNLEFRMVVTSNTPDHVQMSITIEYVIVRRKFISYVEYQWPVWKNISFVNQVEFLRTCPPARPLRVDVDDTGFYTCLAALPPPKKVKEPDYIIYFYVAMFLFACCVVTVACAKYRFIELALYTRITQSDDAGGRDTDE